MYPKMLESLDAVSGLAGVMTELSHVVCESFASIWIVFGN